MTPLQDFIAREFPALEGPHYADLARALFDYVFHAPDSGTFETRRRIGNALQEAGVEMTKRQISTACLRAREDRMLVAWRVGLLRKYGLGEPLKIPKDVYAEYRALRGSRDPVRAMAKRVTVKRPSIRDMDARIEAIVRKMRPNVISFVYRKLRFLRVPYGLGLEDIANDLITTVISHLRWVYPLSDNMTGVFWSRITKQGLNMIEYLRRDTRDMIFEGEGVPEATTKNVVISEELMQTLRAPPTHDPDPWRHEKPQVRNLAMAMAAERLPSSLVNKMNAELGRRRIVDDPERLYEMLGRDQYIRMVRRHFKVSKDQMKSLALQLAAG